MLVHKIVCGPLDVNSYVVSRKGSSCCIIDPGDTEAICRFLQKSSLTCEGILLTHGHFDHIAAVSELHDLLGTTVYIHEYDAPMLSDSNLCLAAWMGQTIKPVRVFEPLTDGRILNLADMRFEVLHTPGHTAGGVSFAAFDERIVFSGDTLFLNGVGRTDFPGGNAETLYNSIQNKLFVLDDDFVVHPGHGGQTTVGSEKEHNAFMRMGKY